MEDKIMNFVVAVVSVVGGVMLKSVADWRLGNRKQSTDEFSVLIKEWKAMYDKMEAKVEMLELKVAEYEALVIDQNKIIEELKQKL